MAERLASIDWQQRFAALSDRLIRHGPLWQERAFHHLRLSWEDAYPGLASVLDTLDLETAEALQGDMAATARWLEPWLPWAPELTALCAVPAGPAPEAVLPERSARDIPGRKRSQIEAFATALADHGLPVLEWCAGKGHLGRALSRLWAARPVIALELQPQLAAAGNRLALRERLPVTLHSCDVLDIEAGGPNPVFDAPVHAVALHACGDLHLALLRNVAAFRVPAVAWSPCCYHLTREATYQPLSAAGHRSGLAPSRDQLRTAVQETVTAPGNARRHRSRLQQWRLGFDLLQRELRRRDEYLAIPTVPPSLAGADFQAFCRHVAGTKSLALPPGIDWSRWEAAGERRFRQVTARDLVRMLFRRPLEVWLALDQLLFLQEQGYRVTLREFCARSATPRNLLLEAVRDRNRPLHD